MRFLGGPAFWIPFRIGRQSSVPGGVTMLPPAPDTAPPAPVTAPPAPVTFPPVPAPPVPVAAPPVPVMAPPVPAFDPPVPSSGPPPFPVTLPAQPMAPRNPAKQATREMGRRAFIGGPPGAWVHGSDTRCSAGLRINRFSAEPWNAATGRTPGNGPGG